MKRRSTRCPCGLPLVSGRCPPCDAIDAQRTGAGRGGGKRREEAREAVRMGTRENGRRP